MNTSTVSNPNSFTDSIQEGLISETEKEIASFCYIEGREQGLKNKPVSEEELKAFAMNRVEAKIQSDLDENQQRHLPLAGMVVAQQVLKETKEKVAPLNATLIEDEHKLRPLEEKKKMLSPDLKKRRTRRIVAIGISLLAAAEGIFSREAFTAARFPPVASLVSAAGIAVAVGFGAHTLAPYLQRARTRIQKFIRYSIVLIPAFIGFYFLGHLRAESYNHVVNLDPTQTSPVITEGVSGWALTIVSFLLFVVALLLSVRFHKTEEENKRDIEYDKICNEINQLKAKMQRTRNEIASIQKNANEKAADALARYEFAKSTENRLLAIARHSMEIYKTSNLRNRTDGACPVFFSNPPPFKFRLFFETFKPANNEKN